MWARVVDGFEVDAHALDVLALACEAAGRCADARDVIDREGVTFRDRWGQPRAHPATTVESTNRLQVARLLREMGLADADEARPPRLTP